MRVDGDPHSRQADGDPHSRQADGRRGDLQSVRIVPEGSWKTVYRILESRRCFN
jgi:hypothetical protein